jgi:hypothetical protein
MASQEKNELPDSHTIERGMVTTEENRDTFLPRPSDDPNDPLNFPLWLKVGLHTLS